MNGAADDGVPFQLQVGYDQAELLGARWWHEGVAVATGYSQRRRQRLADGRVLTSRREALGRLFAIGGVIVAAGLGVTFCSRSNRTTTTVARRNSLEVQKERGIVVDATGVPFHWQNTIDTTARGAALDRSSLAQLASDLRPLDPSWQPAYVPTLFQVFSGPGHEAFTPQFRMVRSPTMGRAFAQAEALRSLIEHAEQGWKWALVIDLPGPESVAFAAGLQPAATAVFVFDNWPHPQGVVPAHWTLGAAVHHRDAFVAGAGPRPRGPAAFVLDRNRLAPYADEPQRFDNRYLAKLPPAAFLRARDVERVLYVVPDGADAVELDDLNERFVEYRTAGITVQMLGLADVREAKPDGAGTAAKDSRQSHYWHGSAIHHWWFWNHYGWPSRPGPTPAQRPPASTFGSSWAPARRSTPFPGVAQLGTTAERRERSGRSTGGTGGSWGRSSGGYGG